MPVHIFSDDERDRLSRCPPDILPEDLTAFFTLSIADREFLRPFRGAANQVGVALQLGLLRYLGFCPDDLQDAPAHAVAYLARQLGVAPQVLTHYGARAQTRTDHLRAVQRYLGFRDADMFDVQALEAWLLERALEHDKPTLLFGQAAGKLQADKIVRPGVTRLERLVAAARSAAWEETFRRATPLLTPEQRALLDGLLRPDPRTNQASLVWLRLGATSNTPAAIRQALTKRAFLDAQGVATWPHDLFTPNRRKFLAQLIPVTLFALLFNGLLCTGALARTLAARQYRDLHPLTIPVLFVVLVAAFSLLTPSAGNRVLVAAFFGLAGVPVLVLLPLTWRHLHERIWDVTLPLTIIATLAMLLTLTGALVGTVGVWLTVHQLLGSILVMILSASLAVIALAQGFARRSLSRVM